MSEMLHRICGVSTHLVKGFLQSRLILLESDCRSFHLLLLVLNARQGALQGGDTFGQTLFLGVDLLDLLIQLLLHLLSLHQHLVRRQTTQCIPLRVSSPVAAPASGTEANNTMYTYESIISCRYTGIWYGGKQHNVYL